MTLLSIFRTNPLRTAPCIIEGFNTHAVRNVRGSIAVPAQHRSLPAETTDFLRSKGALTGNADFLALQVDTLRSIDIDPSRIPKELVQGVRCENGADRVIAALCTDQLVPVYGENTEVALEAKDALQRGYLSKFVEARKQLEDAGAPFDLSGTTFKLDRKALREYSWKVVGRAAAAVLFSSAAHTYSSNIFSTSILFTAAFVSLLMAAEDFVNGYRYRLFSPPDYSAIDLTGIKMDRSNFKEFGKMIVTNS